MSLSFRHGIVIYFFITLVVKRINMSVRRESNKEKWDLFDKGFKCCTKCNETKELDCFHKGKSIGGKSAICKTCKSNKKYYKLKEKGRVWKKVMIEDYELMERPEHQGGLWYLARKMMILND